MLVVIGYESMYGNTHRIADAVASGFSPDDEVTVAPIADVDLAEREPDLLVVGVPTHAHGLPRAGSRRAAIDSATHGKNLRDVDDSAAVDRGAREWLAQLPDRLTTQVAVFDTRFRPPAWLVGHPARRIGRLMSRHGAKLLMSPESFFVDKHEQLLPDELERARKWGATLRERAARGQAVLPVRPLTERDLELLDPPR